MRSDDDDKSLRYDGDGRRRSKARLRGRVSSRPVRVLYDPTNTFPRNGRFSWPDFRLTQRRGYWPEGSIFEIKSRGRGLNAKRFASGKPRRIIKIIKGRAVDIDAGLMLVTGVQAYRWEPCNLPQELLHAAELIQYGGLHE